MDKFNAGIFLVSGLRDLEGKKEKRSGVSLVLSAYSFCSLILAVQCCARETVLGFFFLSLQISFVFLLRFRIIFTLFCILNITSAVLLRS